MKRKVEQYMKDVHGGSRSHADPVDGKFSFGPGDIEGILDTIREKGSKRSSKVILSHHSTSSIHSESYGMDDDDAGALHIRHSFQSSIYTRMQQLLHNYTLFSR